MGGGATAFTAAAAAPGSCCCILQERPCHISFSLAPCARCPPCSVLMGANIAGDIAKGELSEATVGYNVLENALVLQVGAAGGRVGL